MVIIDGRKIYEEPSSCGTCPFMYSGESSMAHPEKGLCVTFDEIHKLIRKPPHRCHKLFKKALQFPEGTELIITDQNEHE